MIDPTSFFILAQDAGPPPEAAGICFLLFFFALMAISALLGVGLLVFWVWMLIDCATKERSEGNDKIIWILVILLMSWLGAAIYYFVRRPQRIAEFGR